MAQVIGAISLLVIACKMAGTISTSNNSNGKVSVDYVNFVVILLTVVTVIFTVGALVLAIFGVYGFETLKKEAANFASKSAIKKIDESFEENGSASIKIRHEVENEDGHLKKWMKSHIEREVVRSILEARSLRQIDEVSLVDPSAPTDEGNVD
ncbi:hypothetical protein [Novosphingobium sp.]|uniref:hypothetical protein n=1 Tax=Novosphingobium sp. TaxID=1874826 RepID=UPI003D0B78EF